MSISLYVHVPFCVKRCIYCDFVSGPYTPEKAAAYAAALKKEISSIPVDRPLSTLYIGGGTPTVLTADLLSDLANHIFDHFNFIDDHESTIEANPGTLDTNKLVKLHSAGMNRINIGVQSFNNNELAFLERIHTESEAEESVRLARDAGFENIGIDLIYGIPGQDIKSWKKTLEKAVSLKPNHISTYELTVEEGTELHRLLSPPHPPLGKGRKDMLNEELIIEMYEYTIRYLSSAGYLHYEISNFALPGSLSRHNLNYWDRGDYYGAGLGAHSFINKKRFYNTDILKDYIKAVSENKSPLKGEEDITEDKALSETIFLGLRKTGGIDIKTISEAYRKDILTLYQKEIEQLQNAGLIKFNNKDHIALTIKGLLLSNEVFAKFI